MVENIDMNQINNKVQLMKDTARELKHLGADFPALARNLVRIEASLKMLEINISDLFELEL